MRKRKQYKALIRWQNDTRQWAHQTARELVLSWVGGQMTPATPYRIGVVLDPGEQVWAECPIQFLQEIVPGDRQPIPPVRPWLVTSDRIVGRLGDDRLYGWRWEQVVGCRLDLSAWPEFVILDLQPGSRLDWTGPGVAPLAVSAVYRLHGQQSLLDHPGLVSIRLPGCRATTQPARHRCPPRILATNGLRLRYSGPHKGVPRLLEGCSTNEADFASAAPRAGVRRIIPLSESDRGRLGPRWRCAGGPVFLLGAAHELAANVDVETGSDVRPYRAASHRDQDWREEVRVACSVEASRSRRADLLRVLLPSAARPWTGQATRSTVVEPASE